MVTGMFGTELMLVKIDGGRPIPPNWHDVSADDGTTRARHVGPSG